TTAKRLTRPSPGRGFCVEKVTSQVPSLVVQLEGNTFPPSAVKFTTVPSGTLLPFRSTSRAVTGVSSPSKLQSNALVPNDKLIPSCVTRELAIEIPFDRALIRESLAKVALISTGPGVLPG